MVFRHITKYQGIITLWLFLLFTFLVLIKIFIPSTNIENAVAIITGWIGVVIGFFFNQQIAKMLEQKVNELEKRKDKFAEKTENMITEIESGYKKIIEKKEQEINELISYFNKKAKE